MYNKSNLSKLEKIDSLAPEVMKAFWVFDKAALAKAWKAGATETEIAEAAIVTAALRAGAAVTRATHAFLIRSFHLSAAFAARAPRTLPRR